MEKPDITLSFERRDHHFVFRIGNYHQEYKALIPSDWLSRLQSGVNFMAGSGQENERHSRQFAIDLFRLLPEDIRTLLWTHRRDELSLLIINTNSRLPWELMLLNHQCETDQYLATRYAIGQWWSDPQALAQFSFTQGGMVRDLRNNPSSLEAIFELVSVPLAKVSASNLEEALGNPRYDFWVLMGHRSSQEEGYFTQPRIQLTETASLHPGTLRGMARGMRQNRPFIFLVSCQSLDVYIQQGQDTGWPEAFFQAGAGAMISQYLPISAPAAAEFIQCFLQFFREKNLPLGESVRLARQQLTLSKGQAFAVFGNPLAQYQAKPLPSRAHKRTKIQLPKNRLWWNLPPNIRAATLLIIVPLMIYLVGHSTMRAREYYLLITSLSYPAGELFSIGFSVPSRALLSLPSIIYSSFWSTHWAVIIAILGLTTKIYLTAKLKKKPSAPLGSRKDKGNTTYWFKVLQTCSWSFWFLAILWLSLLVMVGVRGKSLSAPETFSRLSGNPMDRMAFLGRTWLKNDRPEHDREREGLFGVMVLATLISGGAAWVWWRQPSLLFKGLALCSLGLTLTLLKHWPYGYAYTRWGIDYPRVQIQRHDSSAGDCPDWETGCCLYDISEGAREKILWIHCHDGTRGHVFVTDHVVPYLRTLESTRESIAGSLCD